MVHSIIRRARTQAGRTSCGSSSSTSPAINSPARCRTCGAAHSGSAHVICTGRRCGTRTLHDSSQKGAQTPAIGKAAPEQAPTKRGDTRTKMLISAAEVMRERGAAGVTIDEVLARSGAPRGSVYYHFPDGPQPDPDRGAAVLRRLHHRHDRRRRRPRRQGVAAANSSSSGSGCSPTANSPPAVRSWQRRSAVGRRRTQALRRGRRHPGPLVYRADPRVRQRRLRRRRCRVAGGDVDRRAGGRHRAVPLDAQCGPAASGWRAARIPDQGKGIRCAEQDSGQAGRRDGDPLSRWPAAAWPL